ncbi:major capsid protein [Sinorhizobium meliloti]|uniref:major capsid protein n=1 Tax=Rhizobium meliloti TaxID=382 RepID=UPI001296ED03|nr:major capsid protein [Sinorhizobium meliloti]MQV12208.1 major capsid protein [Sinorhizobium meliloti]
MAKTIDMYSSNAMLATSSSLIAPKLAILDMWFLQEQTEESEEVHFDIELKKRSVAPFVAPTSQGKIVESQGFDSKTFKPAYLKPKTPLRPAAALKRAIGEGLTPSFSALQRRQAALAQTLLEHKESVYRRLNIMATESLVKGQVTVKGEGYATKIVKFGRDESLSLKLLNGDRWDQDTATPIDDLEAMAERVHEIEGAEITDIIMDPVAAKLFRKHKDVREILDIRRAAGAPTAELGGFNMAGTADGLKYLGNFGSFNVWVYSEYYEDPETGLTVPVLAPGTVIGGSKQIEGIRAFGAIHDEEAGMQALPLFHKSWINPDPSYRLVMTQSAPLVFPKRPNGSFSINVLGLDG